MLIVLCFWGVFGSVALADGLVTCGRTGSAQAQAQGCNFSTLFDMINTIIGYVIAISMPLAAIAFAYAGWLRLTSGGNPGQITKSNHVFISVGIGVMVILGGWLVFRLIADTFLNSANNYGTYLK